MRSTTPRSVVLGALLVTGSLLAGGCVGEIDNMGAPADAGFEPTPDGAPLDPQVQTQFETEIDPILRRECIACHAVVGNVNYPPFVTPTLEGSYSTVSSTAALMGNLTPAGAPLLTKINPGPHNGATYSSADVAAITAFLSAQAATGGTPTPPDESPGAISQRLVSEWSGCLSETDFEELNFGETWANKGSNDGNCEQCHNTGAYGFRASDDNSTMYDKLSGNPNDMFGYFSVDVLAGMMIVNTLRFEVVGSGQGIHANHPSFNYSPGDNAMQRLQQLYDRTMQRRAAGECGPPRITF
ncbi:MAG: hypothetical protein R2939_19755 [Kofleriaceae bacterium]